MNSGGGGEGKISGFHASKSRYETRLALTNVAFTTTTQAIVYSEDSTNLSSSDHVQCQYAISAIGVPTYLCAPLALLIFVSKRYTTRLAQPIPRFL